jgi:gliding motility-associated protein GldC
MKKQSKLSINVEMDENHIPESISWESDDIDENIKKKAEAAMLFFWDKADNNAMSLNLWTKDMSIEEMSKFYFQIIMTMADSFEKATNEDQMALALRDFADFFGEKMGVISPTGKFDGKKDI